MGKAENIIMRAGTYLFAVFCIIQTVASVIRGQWFVTLAFVAMALIGRVMLKVLKEEAREEANHDRNKA